MNWRVVLGAVVVASASCAAVWLWNRRPNADRQAASSRPVASASEAPARSIPGANSVSRVLPNPTPAANAHARTEAPQVESAATGKLAASPASAPRSETTPYSRQLVDALFRPDLPTVPRTAEHVAEWKRNLQQLVAQGAGAVGAIGEFLQKNVDLDFGPGNPLGYASARAAMFDALVQIGGPEGLAGTLQTLQNTGDPREIAVLAQNLEKLAPGVYHQEAIAAARDALAMATSGKLEGADVAPLFEVLRSYGDTSVLTDLVRAARQWNYYSAIALAELPDGAGIPNLIELAQGASGGRLNAIEMLAQLSAQYPEARVALIDQARANKISPNMWPYLTPLLAGDIYHYRDSAFDSLPPGTGTRWNTAHVRMGNQNLYTAPAAEILTSDEINQRLTLIEELDSLASDAAARQALDQARELLMRRHPQTLAVSP